MTVNQKLRLLRTQVIYLALPYIKYLSNENGIRTQWEFLNYLSFPKGCYVIVLQNGILYKQTSLQNMFHFVLYLILCHLTQLLLPLLL